MSYDIENLQIVSLSVRGLQKGKNEIEYSDTSKQRNST